MRSVHVLFFVLFLALSCSKEPFLQVEHSDDSYQCFTKVSIADGGSSDPYFVTMDDINAYVTMLIKSGYKREEDVLDIMPMGNEGEVSFYVVSYSSGWEIISSDMRGPVFLAKSDSESFEESFNADYVKIWIGSLAQDIYVRRCLDKIPERAKSEEVKLLEKECIDFWKAINPNHIVDYTIEPTTKMDPGLPIITLPTGHWELASTVYSAYQRDTIGHLCQKKWNQGDPYNYYCPPAVFQSGNCPAGCVAIAGSQMLKFLHDKTGVPISAPLNVDNWGCGYNYSPDAWGLMENNDTIAAALIRDVGHKVGMFYWYDGSGANTEDLVEDVFLPYGVYSTYGNYNHSILTSSLMNSMPVIVSAFGEQDSIFGININSKGHAFIVDKCITADCTVTSTFHWVWDPHITPLPELEDSISVSGALVFEHIGMNWGWNSDDDDLLFSSMGSWEIVLEDASSPDIVHFDYERKMICF